MPLERRGLLLPINFRVAEMGIPGENDRVELIYGRILKLADKDIKHAMATIGAIRYFNRMLGNHTVIYAQEPISLNEYLEPDPEIYFPLEISE